MQSRIVNQYTEQEKLPILEFMFEGKDLSFMVSGLQCKKESI